MKTKEVGTVFQEFLLSGLSDAEHVFEKHVEGYCSEGMPFLSLQKSGEENLAVYANRMLVLCWRERFGEYSEEKIQDVCGSMDLGLLTTLYLDMFCRRYLELSRLVSWD